MVLYQSNKITQLFGFVLTMDDINMIIKKKNQAKFIFVRTKQKSLGINKF